ncbi:hypothetical protein DUNSADRAFT_18485 [Dunaliella salina]|uniref:Encoded protein n=1 Tax=Dunaliella salina TaxID=3046 RepID=A0ABQ7GYY7_DUNSA|nr:hypothetical protein DUNSADRAFT_18485 [Dunaliella salina]|eukprot:KAF5839823.1 hypothetical protein DUNSADRAFT_18485 [Dunaliella salina]
MRTSFLDRVAGGKGREATRMHLHFYCSGQGQSHAFLPASLQGSKCKIWISSFVIKAGNDHVKPERSSLHALFFLIKGKGRVQVLALLF